MTGDDAAAPSIAGVIVLCALCFASCKSHTVAADAGTSKRPDSGLALDWSSACALGTTMGVTKMEPIEWLIPESPGGARPLMITIQIEGAPVGDHQFRQLGLTKFDELTERTLGCPAPPKSRQTVLSRGSSDVDLTSGRVHAAVYDRDGRVVLEYQVFLDGMP